MREDGQLMLEEGQGLCRWSSVSLLWLSRYSVVRLRRRCAGAHSRLWWLDTVWWFMLGCVAFSVYCHAAGAHRCKIRLSCVLRTALDLAAGALCIEWGMGGSKVKVI